MNAAEWNDERRSALASMNETERYAACQHTLRGDNGVCPLCGDSIDREEA